MKEVYNKSSLVERVGRRNGAFWLYLEFVDPEHLAIETSFLPAISEVTRKLKPLGFKRLKSGSYRLVCEMKNDDIFLVLRAANEALKVLLREGYL